MLLPPNQFWLVSVRSISSIHSPMKEDDTSTTISVSSIPHFFPLVTEFTKIYTTDAWRRTHLSSIRSLVEVLPCVHVEKQKHSAHGVQTRINLNNGQYDPYDSPNKARIIEKPSLASTSIRSKTKLGK